MQKLVRAVALIATETVALQSKNAPEEINFPQTLYKKEIKQ